MSNERRAHARYDIRLAAEIRRSAGRFSAVTRDVSAGGCCIEGAYPLEEGGEVSLALFVVVDGIEEASLPPLELRASVQWTIDNDEAAADRRHLAGLRFLDIADSQRQWIEDVVRRGEQ